MYFNKMKEKNQEGEDVDIAVPKGERGEGNSWKDGEGPSRKGSCVYRTWPDLQRQTHRMLSIPNPPLTWGQNTWESALGSGLDLASLDHMLSDPLLSAPCLTAWISWEHSCHPQQHSALTWSFEPDTYRAIHSYPTLSNSAPSPRPVLGPHLCCQTNCHVLSEPYVLMTLLWPCPVASPKGTPVQSQGGWSQITIIPWRLSSACLLLWVSIQQGHMQVCAAAWFPKLNLLFGSSCIGEPTFMLNCSVMSNSCDPMDYSPPGFSVQGIFQARILEWAAISSSRGSSPLSDWTRIYYVSCIVGGFFTHWAIRKHKWETQQKKKKKKKANPGELLTQKVG